VVHWARRTLGWKPEERPTAADQLKHAFLFHPNHILPRAKSSNTHGESDEGERSDEKHGDVPGGCGCWRCRG